MSETITLTWIVVPAVVAILLYMSLALCTWPYARPRFPFWIVFIALFFPPVFLFLCLYMLATATIYVTPARTAVVEVVPAIGASARGRVVAVPLSRSGRV